MAVEAPLGAAFHWLRLDEDGEVIRYRVTPPSFTNWHGFHLAAENFAFQDFQRAAINDQQKGRTSEDPLATPPPPPPPKPVINNNSSISIVNNNVVNRNRCLRRSLS